MLECAWFVRSRADVVAGAVRRCEGRGGAALRPRAARECGLRPASRLLCTGLPEGRFLSPQTQVQVPMERAGVRGRFWRTRLKP